MRYGHTRMEFVWSMDTENKDKNLKETEKESNNRRMAKVCLEAATSINKDLEFTIEIPEEKTVREISVNWTKIILRKFKSQDCTKPNCIYETLCISCWETDKAKVEEMCRMMRRWSPC